jgi:hypothetical protein
MRPRRNATLMAVVVLAALGASAARPAPAAASVCSLPVVTTACDIGGGVAKGAGDLVHGHVGRAVGDVANGGVKAGCSLATSVLSPTCRAVVHGAATAAGDVLSGHPGRVVSDAVGGVTGAITGWVTDGVAGLLRTIGHVISKTSSPVLSARWFKGQYLSMMGIAALIAVPLLLLLVGQALVQQSPALLATGVAKTLLAFVLAATGVVVVQLLLGVTDELSATVARTTGVDLAAWFGHLAKATAVLPGVGLFIVFVVGVITALAGLAVWIELLIREAGVYIVCFFLPLILVAMIWPATARWTRRGIELLVAIILAKFLLVAIVALGAAAAGQPGPHPSLNAALIGTGILILAAFSPFTVLALVPHAEHALSVSRGNSHAGLLASTTTNQAIRGAQLAGAFGSGGATALASAGGAAATTPEPSGTGTGPPGTDAGSDAKSDAKVAGTTPARETATADATLAAEDGASAAAAAAPVHDAPLGGSETPAESPAPGPPPAPAASPPPASASARTAREPEPLAPSGVSEHPLDPRTVDRSSPPRSGETSTPAALRPVEPPKEEPGE